MQNKKKLLFLCTGNACCSQMAEGFCRALAAERYDAYSAGIETHGLNPDAVKVMKETGVDISAHYSKTLAELGDITFDYVITVCSHADENCPTILVGTEVIHREFPDPPQLALEKSDTHSRIECFRLVRDEIREYIESLTL